MNDTEIQESEEDEEEKPDLAKMEVDEVDEPAMKVEEQTDSMAIDSEKTGISFTVE